MTSDIVINKVADMLILNYTINKTVNTEYKNA